MLMSRGIGGSREGARGSRSPYYPNGVYVEASDARIQTACLEHGRKSEAGAKGARVWAGECGLENRAVVAGGCAELNPATSESSLSIRLPR